MRKGQMMPESAREKVAEAQRRRWAEYRAKRAEAAGDPERAKRHRRDFAAGRKLVASTALLTVRCAKCDWSAEGPAASVVHAQLAHSEEAHGITAVRRRELAVARR